MIHILDTDMLTILQTAQQPQCDRLTVRLNAVPGDSVTTTVVNYQEQFQGWQALLGRVRRSDDIVRAYRELVKIQQFYRDFVLLPFDDHAQKLFEGFRRQKIRTRTMDLRIACVALAHDATLLTRNLRDFRPIPGLRVEDWAA